MNYPIRDADAADTDSMVALLPQLADFDVPKNRNPDHLWEGDKAMLLSWLAGEEPNSFARVATTDSNTVVGVALTTMREEMLSHEPSAHLEALAVSPQHLRQGIGQALIADCEQQAKSRGALSLTLHVFANNKRAQALYKKSGFSFEIIRSYKEL